MPATFLILVLVLSPAAELALMRLSAAGVGKYAESGQRSF